MDNVELLISKKEVKKELENRIAEGTNILDTNYIDMDEAAFEEMVSRRNIWDDYNAEYLQRVFSNPSIAGEYKNAVGGVMALGGKPLELRRAYVDKTIRNKISRIKSIIRRLPLFPTKKHSQSEGTVHKKSNTQNVGKMIGFFNNVHQDDRVTKTVNNSQETKKDNLWQKYWWLFIVPILAIIIGAWVTNHLGLTSILQTTQTTIQKSR